MALSPGENTDTTPQGNTPLLSIIVVAYNMERELPRTLLSLGRDYQQGVDSIHYEVIVVDNGSDKPVRRESVTRHGTDFQLIRIDNADPSPARAVNIGLKAARGEYLAIIVDGARLVTPGVIHWAMSAFQLQQRAIVSVVGLHLGPDLQRFSSRHGYTQLREDQLLERIDWPAQPYRLFEIASLAASSISGWSGPQAESNCIFLHRDLCEELSGFDERFSSPGGGLVNLDFYKRACESEGVELFCLNGEGSFHQIHGGATTGGQSREEDKLSAMRSEYQSIRGGEFRVPEKRAVLLGRSQPGASRLASRGADYISDAYGLENSWRNHMTAVGLDLEQLHKARQAKS